MVTGQRYRTVFITNEGESVVTERFIRTLKNKIYKCLTSISKYVYIDKLDYIVNEYKNKYHSTMKMTPFDIKGITYIDFNIENILNDFEI